jgi:hypothetical protein
MKLLIDGDIMIFKAACAAEEVIYEVESEGRKQSIKGAAEGRKYLGGGVGRRLLKTYVVQGPEAACGNLRAKINTVLNKIPHSDYQFYLSSLKTEVNRRAKMAKRLPYKADRPSKPINYLAVREYLINNYPTVVAKEGEADDLLGIDQADNTAIVTIDKDLLQVPGNHYHLDSGAHIHVSDPGTISLGRVGSKSKLTGSGFLWFCAQLLIGDRIDSIVGIPGCGPVEATRLLSTAKTEAEAWDIVKKRYLRETKYGTEEQRYAALCEMARLAWIARSKETLYSPMINGEFIVPRIEDGNTK